MGIRRLPFVGIVTPDMHWLLSFGSMLIYKCATVAGDIIMQRRCCRNTNKGVRGLTFCSTMEDRRPSLVLSPTTLA